MKPGKIIHKLGNNRHLGRLTLEELASGEWQIVERPLHACEGLRIIALPRAVAAAILAALP
jgi:hypothetical protein